LQFQHCAQYSWLVLGDTNVNFLGFFSLKKRTEIRNKFWFQSNSNSLFKNHYLKS
jgi:hypothetical protein